MHTGMGTMMPQRRYHERENAVAAFIMRKGQHQLSDDASLKASGKILGRKSRHERKVRSYDGVRLSSLLIYATWYVLLLVHVCGEWRKLIFIHISHS